MRMWQAEALRAEGTAAKSPLHQSSLALEDPRWWCGRDQDNEDFFLPRSRSCVSE